MDIISLINRLKSSDITLSLSGNDLEINFEGDDLPAAVLSEIKINKSGIVDFLKKTAGGREALIPVAPEQPGYPVSSSQKRLWIVSQFEETSRAYNLPGVYVFEGNMNIPALEAALKTLITRHEILRTVFRENEQGDIRQIILPADEPSFRLQYHDLQQMEQQEACLHQQIRADIDKPFQLSAPPLFRTGLYQLAPGKWVFIYVIHHIISDGWSMNILVNELLLLYNTYLQGAVNPLMPLRIQYRDFAHWQQQELNNPSFADHRAWWLQQYEGELPLLELPADKPRPLIKSYNGGMVHRRIAAGITKEFAARCQEQAATLFMGLLAAVDILLFRYTGQTDLVIGSPIAGRDHTELENQIGFYVNTMALRSRFRENDSFHSLLAQVKTFTLGAYEHQVYPFDQLVEDLQLQKDRGRNPLFDVWVVLQNTQIDNNTGSTQQLGEVKISTWQEEQENVSRFDLSFNFTETGSELDLTLVYNSDLFVAQTAERMIRHLEQLLLAIIENPGKPVSHLQYLSSAELHTLLTEFNQTENNDPGNKTVIDLFREQAQRTPDAPALQDKTAHYTYRSLDEYANRLANYLHTYEPAASGKVVGILLDNSASMVITILAVLKAGMAYLPLDPESPPSRIEYILQESGTRIVLTATVFELLITSFTGQRILLDDWESLPGNRQDPAIAIHPADLAYIIYTSGSTGHPKGVMIRHECLTDYYYGILSQTNIGDCKTFGLVSTMAADLGNTVLYPALLTGGALYIFSRNDLPDPEQLFSRQLDCLKIVPSHWKSLQHGDQLLVPEKCLIFGGEALTPGILEMIRNSGSRCRVFNHYGPTETTIGKLINAIDLDNIPVPVPLGKPFCQAAVYILDSHLQPVPTGVPGEICIAGRGVATGYLHQPALTAERFINNPFNHQERMYRTGDLGRWLPNGTIEFLGRRDDQVKIHGYRIGITEIEKALQQYPGVEAAFISIRTGEDGDKELLAYLQGNGQPAAVRTWLATILPSYMVPAHFLFLAQLPLTANGKVDRKKLPAPEGTSLPSGMLYVPPGNDTEAALVDAWKEILGKEQVSVTDNFFLIGGHSLSVVRLASRIYKTFQVKLGLKDFFDYSILKEQAALIRQAQRTAFMAISPVEAASGYALSSSQKRLWLLCQHASANNAYNIPAAFQIEGELDLPAFNLAFQALLQRHESLRTIFINNEQGQVQQCILPADGTAFSIDHRDLRLEQQPYQWVNTWLVADCLKPFDLANGPLLRVSLLHMADKKWIFQMVLHHIISDGWSMGILFSELLACYKAASEGLNHSLAPLRIQYKDYAAWQQQQLTGETFDRHRNYWLQQLAGELPVLDVPGDHKRPAMKTFHGGAIIQKLDAGPIARLKNVATQQGATLFMGLLALVKVLLYRYTGQEDIIVGSPVAGREHPDLEDQIGFYVNTLTLRTRFNGEDPFREILSQVRGVTLQAFEHQAYPFEELVEELQLQRDMSRNPLFDVMVILQSYETGRIDAAKELPGLAVTVYKEGEGTVSKFDLTFSFAEIGEAVHCRIEFNKDIYAEETVLRIGKHLEQLLNAVTSLPDAPVNSLQYITGNEWRKLQQFNEGPSLPPAGKTMVVLFEEQVEKTPDKTAVVFDGTPLSYAGLNRRANQLAGYLRHRYNIQPGDLAGLMLHRSEKLIISILGIIKAGGAYMPIDPDYPQPRIDYMRTDSRCRVLLDEQEWEQFQAQAGNYPEENLEQVNSPADLMYVIYTSGSTGKPKGVMIPHAAISNTILSQQIIFGVEENYRHLQFASPSFDASVSEIFVSLLSGGALYIIPEEEKRNPSLLATFIAANAIDIATIPPAYLKVLEMNSISTLKKLVSAGEAAILDKAIDFLQYGTFLNAYGPTECSICTTAHIIPHEGSVPASGIPIGRPIHNTKAYILDSELQPVPVGVYGELYFSGPGLASGYLHQPALTAEKFVPNPFVGGTLLYKSGDRGRWLPDGNIEFAGRKDEQVKVRGHRIELGEIEHLLQQHAAVQSTVVMVRVNRREENEIVAYTVCLPGTEPDKLKAYLAEELPPYMLPAHIVMLEQLPVTLNGKLDKKQLPDPYEVERATGLAAAAPENELQQKLVNIWEAILDREKPGIHDDYFMLGGDSLKVISILQRVLDETGVVIPINIIFQERTIEKIATWLQEAMNNVTTQSASTTVASTAQPDLLDVSYNQLTFLSGTKKENQLVITPYEFHDLDVEAFTAAIHQLVERHEILRTQFIRTEAGIMQKILPSGASHIEIPPVIQVVSAEQLDTIHREAHERKVDPFQDALIYVQISQLDSSRFQVLLTIHHALTDGFSEGILRKEILQLYNAIVQKNTTPFKPLPFHYRDFIQWQRNFIASDEGHQHRQFWLRKLENFPATPVNGMGDKQQPLPDNHQSICITRLIHGSLLEKLDIFVKKHGLTRPAFLLGALHFLTSQEDQQDPFIFLTLSGRQSKYYGSLDVSGLIGLFANPVVIAGRVNKTLPAAAYFLQVQQHFLEALSYDAYPLEKLMRELPQVKPGMYRQGQVYFNYHNYAYLRSHSYTITEEEVQGKLTYREPMEMLTGIATKEYKNCLKLEISFNHHRYTPAEATETCDYFFSILARAIVNEQLPAQQQVQSEKTV